MGASSERAQVAVVGSGPGGAVVTHTLTALGYEVVLLEEGSRFSQTSHPAFSLGEVSSKYRNAGLTVALGNPKISYAEGRCLGGGSEVNAGLYHRASAEVLDGWGREFSVEEMGESALAHHFEACERDIGISENQGEPQGAARCLRKGSSGLGWASQSVRRLASASGRHSMSETLIPKAILAGARVLTDRRVTNLSERKGGWELHCRSGDGARTSVFAESVFISCGAIQTPALLQRSGVPGSFGKTLQFHPSLKVIARFPTEVNFAGMGVLEEQVLEFKPKLTFGCSISSPEHLAAGLAGFPQELRRLSHEWQRMAAYYVSISPRGRGSVRAVPGFKDPLVRFKLEKSDLSLLADGLRKLCRILLEGGAEAVFTGYRGLPPIRRIEDIGAIPEMLEPNLCELMSVHLFSSCPMNGGGGSVDSFGKVRGVENLFIADASVLCTAPGVNPQGTLMAIARRNAYRFAGKV